MTAPFRARVLLDGPGVDRLREVLSKSKPGSFAPATQWANAHTRALKGIKEHGCLMSLDAMRQAHFLLIYGAHKGYHWEDASWSTKRKESLAWLEGYITELVRNGAKQYVKTAA